MIVANTDNIISSTVTPPYITGQEITSLWKLLIKATNTVGIPSIRERKNVHLHL